MSNPVTDWLAVHHGIDQHPPSEGRVRASRRAYDAVAELIANSVS